MFPRSALVAGDAFFGLITRGFLPPWTEQAHRQNEVVISAAAAAAGRLGAGGYTVVYDGVVGPWFVDAFGQAAGLARLHYAVLLPPEHVCLHRVESRVGHGFNDLEAARRMYGEFTDAVIDRRHVIARTDEASVLATHLHRLVQAGSIVRSVHPRRAQPGQ